MAISLAAILLASAVTVPRLSDRDREVIAVAAIDAFHQTTAGENPDDHSLISAWTVSVTDRMVRAYKDPKREIPLHVEEFEQLPEYQAMIRRAATRFDVGRIRTPFVWTAIAPRLCCDPEGGPPAGSPYEEIVTVSPPGYAPDGRAAILYLRAVDCYSECISLVRLVRRNGGWKIDREWSLYCVGE